MAGAFDQLILNTVATITGWKSCLCFNEYLKLSH